MVPGIPRDDGRVRASVHTVWCRWLVHVMVRVILRSADVEPRMSVHGVWMVPFVHSDVVVNRRWWQRFFGGRQVDRTAIHCVL